MPQEFVQDNVSISKKGTLRITLSRASGSRQVSISPHGESFRRCGRFAARKSRFGRWVGVELSSERREQLWIPEGFAHGFCVLSEQAEFFYKCTAPYSPESEYTIRYNDPEIGIRWPVDKPILSKKDQEASLLANIAELPIYKGIP